MNNVIEINKKYEKYLNKLVSKRKNKFLINMKGKNKTFKK